MAVDDGFAIGDTPRVFRRGEIATSHQSNECNRELCVCVSFLLLVRSCRDFVPTNGGLIPSWLEEPTSVHSTGGVVHAWVGQKLLNCFILKCFTRKTLKKKSIGHR